MAAQVDLLRSKVEEERLRDSLDRFIKERKKKKKRDASPPADKRERHEKEEKKGKLHHHQHAEHRTHQPHQLQQQNPKPPNFSAGKHVPNSHKHSHHHHHHHHHNNHSLTNGTKKSLQPSARPPREVPEQLQKKRAVPPEPPALFTFTPLKMVKAKPQDFKEKHRDKDLKLNLKKENTEANVKHVELKKKKGEFYYFVRMQNGTKMYFCGFPKWF